MTLTHSKAEARTAADRMAPMLPSAPEQVYQSPHTLIGNPQESVAELQRRVREWEISILFVPGDSAMLRRLMEEALVHF